MAIAISIEGLSKNYAGRIAVDNLNLSIQAGQVFGFLGPNGAGKTTTLKMICGLVIPDTGSVSLNGYDINRRRSKALRQVGAVLEGTRNVYWRFTAWDNVIYFGRLRGWWGKALRERAEQLLRDLDLWAWRDEPVQGFSRGMQQKVAIACALITDPSIALLDEPTLGLDVVAARTLKNWMVQLAHERGKTIILTTHQLDLAQAVCDRIAIMSKGRLLVDQAPSAMLEKYRLNTYQIRLQGLLSRQLVGKALVGVVQERLNGHAGGTEARSFAGLTVNEDRGETIISGTLDDQSELYALLDKVRAIDMPLIEVRRIEPQIEDVFMQLVEGVKDEQRCSGHLQ